MSKQHRWVSSLALGCVPLALAAQSTAPWTKFVDGRVSVMLPIAPYEVSPQQMGATPSNSLRLQLDRKTGFIAQDKHGTYLLIINGNAGVIVKGYEGVAFNPENQAVRRAYYDQSCHHIAQREGGTVLARSFFSTPAGEGTEFKYTGQLVGTDRLVVKYSRQVLVGPVDYFLNFIPADRTDSTGQAGHEQRRRFFDSLAVTPVSDK